MLNLTGLFAIPGSVEKVEPYGNGHINQTYLVTADCGRYILQRINDSIFTDVDGLMHNIHAVTEYLAASDPDPQHVLRIVPARDGGTYIRNDKGCWRLYNFIENSLCLEKVGTAQDFETSAFAFGDFQRRLKQFPASTLTETIARFHDTPDRYRIFREALERTPWAAQRTYSRKLNSPWSGKRTRAS